jgi:hypothetical protein
MSEQNCLFCKIVAGEIPAGVVYTDGIIPQSEITPFARKVFGDLQSPNLAGAANNYSVLPRSQFFNDKGDVKLDFKINNKTTAFVRGSSRKLNNFEAPTISVLVFDSFFACSCPKRFEQSATIISESVKIFAFILVKTLPLVRLFMITFSVAYRKFFFRWTCI